MRALLLLALLTGCRAAPAWEAVGGFELLPEAEAWREVKVAELEGWLAEAEERIALVRDYTATLETRERIGDELFPRRVMRVKVREQPLAVAIETLEPPSESGQRVWYDEKRGRKLVAETPGFLGNLIGRVSLDPRGERAMENRRHPITDIGLARLIAQVEEEFHPALARRSAPRLRSTELPFGAGRMRVVDALVPSEPPDQPLVHRLGFATDSGLLAYYGRAELLPEGLALVEEYGYRDLALNPGLSDEDFAPEK